MRHLIAMLIEMGYSSQTAIMLAKELKDSMEAQGLIPRT